jgi:hypothetical protein
VYLMQVSLFKKRFPYHHGIKTLEAKITESRFSSIAMNNILNTCSLACSHIPVIIPLYESLYFSIVILRKKYERMVQDLPFHFFFVLLLLLTCLEF